MPLELKPDLQEPHSHECVNAGDCDRERYPKDISQIDENIKDRQRKYWSHAVSEYAYEVIKTQVFVSKDKIQQQVYDERARDTKAVYIPERELSTLFIQPL